MHLIRRAGALLSSDVERYAKALTYMPTPRFYKRISEKCLLLKWHLLFLTGVGAIICILSILFSIKYQMNLFPLFGMGILAIIWAWGIFLVGMWYGKKSSIVHRIPKAVVSFAEWGSSLFLDIWFIVGTLYMLVFIWHALFGLKA